MPYSMSDKCGTCGHQRQHHTFPSWTETYQDKYDRESKDPGCMLGHSKRLGTIRNPEWTVTLKSSTGEPCPCKVFKD